MKRFSQFIFGIALLFASTNAFAGGVYASFRNSDQNGQTVNIGNSLTYPTTDSNIGGGITKQTIGDGNPGDQFTVNLSGDYLIISTVSSMSLDASLPTLEQSCFDMLVNGVEQDRITTNVASSIILPLKAGDVIRFDAVRSVPTNPDPIVLVANSGFPQSETNTSTLTFVKIDGLTGGAAANSTCSGGLH